MNFSCWEQEHQLLYTLLTLGTVANVCSSHPIILTILGDRRLSRCVVCSEEQDITVHFYCILLA